MKKLEDELIQYLEQFLNNHYSENYEYITSDYEVIEIDAVGKKDKNYRCIIIRFGINHNNQQIYISNLHMPFDLKYQGIGKKLILIVYTIAKMYNYDVFVVQLVDSFREKLLRRGAGSTNEYYTLQITDTTNLL